MIARGDPKSLPGHRADVQLHRTEPRFRTDVANFVPAQRILPDRGVKPQSLVIGQHRRDVPDPCHLRRGDRHQRRERVHDGELDADGLALDEHPEQLAERARDAEARLADAERRTRAELETLGQRQCVNDQFRFLKVILGYFFRDSFFLDKDDIKNYILPSFTKKIFKSIIRY